MVRETRYLWVGNLPEKITKERIDEHFQRYGKIQSVKLVKKDGEDASATVAFMDIRSASKAHTADNAIDGVKVLTQYSDSTSTAAKVARPEQAASVYGHRYPGRPEGVPDERSFQKPDYYSGREPSYERRSFEEYPRGQNKPKFDGPPKGQGYKGQFFERETSQPRSTPRGYVSDDREWQRPTSPARSIKKSPGGQPRSRSSSASSSGSSGSSRSRSRSSRKLGKKKDGASSTSSESSRLQPQLQPQISHQISQDSEGKPGEKEGDLGIQIRNMPLRSSDTSLRDGLFHEYKKHGKVTSVHVFGQSEDRYAIISFRMHEDALKAYEASQGKLFFGTKIEVSMHPGFAEVEDEFNPPELKLDEYHPKATRTLFVGNLEKDITPEELREIFGPFGEIIDVDVKKQGAVSAYGFVQYSDIQSVVKALRKMDGEHIGPNKIKLGYGKSMPTNSIWLDNIAETVAERMLVRSFGRYGGCSHSVIDRALGRALIYFENMEFAQCAVAEMKGRALGGKKLQIDFASRECQSRFFEKMERTGQLRPGERPDERGGRWFKSQQDVFDDAPQQPPPPSGSGNYNFKGQGRGGYGGGYERGGRGYSRGGPRGGAGGFTRGRGQRSFYDPAFAAGGEEFARQRSFEDYAPEGGYDDSYEAELREYKEYNYQQQRGRREAGSYSPDALERSQDGPISPFGRPSSPPFERMSRLDSFTYPEKYNRDTASESGDRESVRSYRSNRSESRREPVDKHFEDKYGRDRYYDEFQDKRPQSPVGSEYSQKSRGSPRRKSRTPSPLSHKYNKNRDRSRGSPSASVDYSVRDGSRPPSPMDYEYSKYNKKIERTRQSTEDMDLKLVKAKSKRSGRISDESSDIERRKSVKPKAYQSDNENSDTEHSVRSDVGGDIRVKKKKVPTATLR